MEKICAKVEVSRTRYSVYAVDYAAFTTGVTMAELKANMFESLNLYFEANDEKNIVGVDDILFELED